MTNLILKLLFCHLFGDYVLQTPYLAETKVRTGIICLYIVHCTVFPYISALVWNGNWQLCSFRTCALTH